MSYLHPMLHAANDFVPPPLAASCGEDPAGNEDPELFGPAILRAERRLRILSRLTDIGMDITEALHDRVLAEGVAAAAAHAPATPGAPEVSARVAASKAARFDPVEAFAKISRAVRLTVNLEGKADEALRALQSGQFVAREAHRAERQRRQDAASSAKYDVDHNKVGNRVSKVIDRESLNETDYVNLMEALEERLDGDVAYLDIDIDGRPLRETVERLCHDLGLSPDWTRWSGDDWIDEGPWERPPWSVFNTPSRKPLTRNIDPYLPSSG